jgi:hypothetical protein
MPTQYPDLGLAAKQTVRKTWRTGSAGFRLTRDSRLERVRFELLVPLATMALSLKEKAMIQDQPAGLDPSQRGTSSSNRLSSTDESSSMPGMP